MGSHVESYVKTFHIITNSLIGSGILIASGIMLCYTGGEVTLIIIEGEGNEGRCAGRQPKRGN